MGVDFVDTVTTAKSTQNVQLHLPSKETLKKIIPFTIILGWTFFYLNIWDLWKTKDRSTVPILGAFFTLLSSSIWFLYGMTLDAKDSRPVKFSALLGIVGALGMVGIYYFVASDVAAVESS